MRSIWAAASGLLLFSGPVQKTEAGMATWLQRELSQLGLPGPSPTFLAVGNICLMHLSPPSFATGKHLTSKAFGSSRAFNAPGSFSRDQCQDTENQFSLLPFAPSPHPLPSLPFVFSFLLSLLLTGKWRGKQAANACGEEPRFVIGKRREI